MDVPADDEALVSHEVAPTPESKPPLVSLTSLEPVPISQVWPTEAKHFTPWLLDNGDMLSRILGVDIELESREYRVGKFSLDIIGREVSTGNPVIIENQYGWTDHTHLGQILTYVGGTKPTTIVWIAEQFREEHRAALEWLNVHTEPGIRFFGVRLGAVTLAGAPPGLIAPELVVEVKPNDWEKRALAATSAGTSTPTAVRELYLQFWSQFEPLAKQRGWTNASPSTDSWWRMPTGLASANWSVSYVRGGCRSELLLDHPEPTVNQTRWQILKDQREALVKEFDGELIFDDLPSSKRCRVEARLNGPKISEKERWTDVIDWMIDTQVRLRRAVMVVVGGVLALVSVDGDDGE